MAAVAKMMNCKIGSLPFSYLGLPIGARMNRFEHWAPVINKFQNKLSNWKASTLSAGGRLTLCKSVLGSLSIFFFSIFKAPVKVLNFLESMRRRFFWGMKENESKISWVAWNKICADMESGGLGVGSLKAQNIALMVKWWWRFYTEEGSLWKSVIQALHGLNGGLKEPNRGGKMPGLWRNIVKVHGDLIKVNIPLKGWFQCNIGVNSNLRFWKDEWVQGGLLKERFKKLFSLEANKDCLLKERLLLDDNNNCSGCLPQWRRQLSSADEFKEWSELFSACIMSGVIGNPEKWSWNLEPLGSYTVSSLRRAYDDLTLKKGSGIPFWWIKTVPGKVNLVVWRISHKSLPTLINLQKRGIQLVSLRCALCGEEDESEEHIFGNCSYFKRCLNDFCVWWKVPQPAPSLEFLLQWGKHLNLKGDVLKAFMGSLYVLLWIVWNKRNNLIFNSNGETKQGKLQAASFFWIKNRWGKNSFIDWNSWCNDPLMHLCNLV